MLSKIAIFDQSSNKFVIREEKIDQEKLASSEVLVRHTVIAINEIDVADSSIRKITNLGYSACGEVVACGSDVHWLNRGDRVAYFNSIGSYRDNKIVDSSKLVKVPDQINSNVATAVIYRGIVAHMALVRTFLVADTTKVLVDGINTATGAVMGWMAKKRGGKVIGITTDNGDISPNVCDNFLNRSSKTLTKDVIDLSGGTGAHLYISTLKYIEAESIIEMLEPAGVILDSIGCITGICISKLMSKSLFMTAPNMSDYKSLRTELILTFDEVVSMLNERPLQITFSQYKFSQIDEAFAEVSSGKSSSAVVLNV
jgi:NADPH2:quinone reductase